MSSILPHEISCGLFIQVICQKLVNSDGWNDMPVTKEMQRKVLISILKLIKNSDIDWITFRKHVQETCSDDLFSLFITSIYSIEDLDRLLDVFKTLEELITDHHSSTAAKVQSSNTNLIKRTSILGLFLRKLILKYKKLSFEDVNKPLKVYQKYVQVVGKKSLSDKSYSDNSRSMDLTCADESNMEQSILENEKENMVYMHQQTNVITLEDSNSSSTENRMFMNKNNVVRFIEEQMNLLETNNRYALPPNELQDRIHNIQRLHSGVVDVFYLSFMNYMRVLEVNKATTSLRLYFDNKVFNNNDSDKSDFTELERHQVMFRRFRYCALNLGIMHCCHGNYNKALMSLKEAVYVSQETNDDLCLKHAMFWLNIVKEETGQQLDKNIESLSKELTKAIYAEDDNVQETVQGIDCLGLLRYSKILAFRGIQKPSNILGIISRIIVSNTSVSNIAQLTQSSLLDMYGFKHLSMYQCQISLQNINTDTNLATGKSLDLTEECLVSALCQLAAQYSNILQYHEAISILEFLKNQLPVYSRYLKSIKQCTLQILFQKCLNERSMKDAISINKFIKVIDELDGEYYSALIDVIYGNFSSAFNNIQHLLHGKYEQMLSMKPTLKIQLKLLFIEIQLLSVNPMEAGDNILQLLSYVTSNDMYSMRVDVNICLIRFHVMSGLFVQAEHVINNIFVEAFANGNCQQQGLLYFYLGKCAVGKEDGEIDMETRLLSAVSFYEKALKLFTMANSKARMKDVYYEQALLYHDLERVQERNTAATQYRLLHELLDDYSNCVLY